MSENDTVVSESEHLHASKITKIENFPIDTLNALNGSISIINGKNQQEETDSHTLSVSRKHSLKSNRQSPPAS